MTLEELLAREGIQQTIHRYNAAGDRGRLEELVGCFVEEGVLEIRGSWRAAGRDAIRTRLAQVRDDGGFLLRHHLTTQHVELSPDGADARAWTYFVVWTDRGPDHAGRYIDHLRRVGADWLLAHRAVAVEWRSADSRFPE